jgi:hypothetical protein
LRSFRLRALERDVGLSGGALTRRRNFIDAPRQRGEVIGERFYLCREVGDAAAERRVAALRLDHAFDLVEPRAQIRRDRGVLRGDG